MKPFHKKREKLSADGLRITYRVHGFPFETHIAVTQANEFIDDRWVRAEPRIIMSTGQSANIERHECFLAALQDAINEAKELAKRIGEPVGV